MRKLKAALCAVIGDDSNKIEKAKEIYRDQACIHVHEHGEHGEIEECHHHHEENNFLHFLMKYELEEEFKIKGTVDIQKLVAEGIKRSFSKRSSSV